MTATKDAANPVRGRDFDDCSATDHDGAIRACCGVHFNLAIDAIEEAIGLDLAEAAGDE